MKNPSFCVLVAWEIGLTRCKVKVGVTTSQLTITPFERKCRFG